MTITAFSGPAVVFGQVPYPPLEYNPDLGPSAFFGGAGLLDQRGAVGYEPGQAASNITAIWYGTSNIQTVNYVPSTLAAANIAASQTPVSGTAVTLVSSTAAGITVNASVVNQITNLSVTGLRLIDGLAWTGTGYINNGGTSSNGISGNILTVSATSTGTLTVGSVITTTGVAANLYITGIGPSTASVSTYYLSGSTYLASGSLAATAGILGVPRIPYGSNAGMQAYNPACMIGRNVRITTAAGDTAVYTVSGYDVYGYPMTEAITANGASTVSGKKAFKYIASVTPVGTVGATITVGTGDVYGFPINSSSFYDVQIFWAGALIVSSTGYTAGTLVSPSTSTTVDVRGTYATQSASNNSNQLVIIQSPPAINAVSSTAMFGVTQA